MRGLMATDMIIQEQLTSLSDEKLEIFKAMYKYMQTSSDYIVPYVTLILGKLEYCTPITYYNNSKIR